MNETWTTISGHPASHLQYQEDESGQARVTQGDAELVSPSVNTDSVYRQYTARVQRFIDEAV